MSTQELGIIGLGHIGGNLARQALEKDIRIVGMDTTAKPDIEEMGATVLDADAYETFAEELSQPRAIYLSLPAGPLIDDELNNLLPHLDEGDVIMDGGNSFWRDSMRREQRVWDDGIYYLDTGTSGGPPGARTAACFMVGGRQKGFDIVEPILDTLSVDQGLVYTGGPGTGHFVKLVHNGVEFGMLQAIGEGIELLEASNFDLDMEDILTNWSHGSVIRSWLVELMAKGFRHEDQFEDAPDFEEVPNYIEDTGEVNWLVEEAIKSETPIPVISQAVQELFKSRGNQKHAYQAIAMMRHGFGYHPFGESEAIAAEREKGMVEDESRLQIERSPYEENPL